VPGQTTQGDSTSGVSRRRKRGMNQRLSSATLLLLETKGAEPDPG
jgi:hypothetical protein